MYGTIAEWRTYAAARGDTAPADDTLATEALTRASDYIQYSYVQHFTAAYDGTEDVVKYAAYEAGLLEAATVGFFSKTFTPDQQKVLTKVGEIAWQPVGSADGADGARPVSTKVAAMLEPMTGRNRGIGMLAVGPAATV